MKTMKKLFALLLAVLMVMGMATTAMADTANDITIKNSAENHKYDAYQLFKGTVTTGGVVSNIKWGSAIPEGDRYEFVEALKGNTKIESYFAGITLANNINNDVILDDVFAEKIGDAINDWSHNEDEIQAFADIVSNFAKVVTDSSDYSNGEYKLTINEAGYYFIKETTQHTATNPGTDGYTDYLMVLSGTTVEVKNSAPTFNQTVNYRVDGTYHETVDAEIDAPVFIKLETALPSLYDDYNQYYLGFKTTLPAGLEFVERNSGGVASYVVEAYILHAGGVVSDIIDSGEFTVKANGDKTIFVDFGNLHDEAVGPTGPDMLSDDKLVIKLLAKVNTTIGFGNDNDNDIVSEMIYSNDMNESEPSLGTDEHWTDAEKGVSYAKLSDTSKIYSYQITFQKQDSANHKPLADAKFRLYRTVTTEVDDNGVKKTVNTDYYAEFQYDANTNTYLITDWKKKDEVPAYSESATNDDTILTSSAVTETGGNYTGGTFIVKGLDSLTYSLEEVKAPSGYNQMKQPVKFSISMTMSGSDLASLFATVDSNNVNGTVNDAMIGVAPIYNTPGSSLPTTGGIGTTIFYIVGGVLVLGAGAAFVMKRRNEA